MIITSFAIPSQKPMTDDELAEALSSDFTSAAAPAEEKTSPTEVLIFFAPLRAFIAVKYCHFYNNISL